MCNSRGAGNDGNGPGDDDGGQVAGRADVPVGAGVGAALTVAPLDGVDGGAFAQEPFGVLDARLAGLGGGLGGSASDRLARIV